MGNLTNEYINQTYPSLVKFANSYNGVSGSLQYLQDGIGDNLPIQISETSLTFPGMQFPVDRRQKIKIRYSDQNWTLKLREFDDVLAIVIQQGYDHLKGKLIID